MGVKSLKILVIDVVENLPPYKNWVSEFEVVYEDMKVFLNTLFSVDC